MQISILKRAKVTANVCYIKRYIYEIKRKKKKCITICIFTFKCETEVKDI